MTITLGYWLIPTVVTVAVLLWALWPSEPTGHGADIAGAFVFLCGMIVSLAAWLVWALVA